RRMGTSLQLIEQERGLAGRKLFGNPRLQHHPRHRPSLGRNVVTGGDISPFTPAFRNARIDGFMDGSAPRLDAGNLGVPDDGPIHLRALFQNPLNPVWWYTAPPGRCDRNGVVRVISLHIRAVVTFPWLIHRPLRPAMATASLTDSVHRPRFFPGHQYC